VLTIFFFSTSRSFGKLTGTFVLTYNKGMIGVAGNKIWGEIIIMFTLIMYSLFSLRREAADFIVVMVVEATSAAQLMTVAFETGDAVSEELESCTMSKKYVINSPRSCKCMKIQHKSRSGSILLYDNYSGNETINKSVGFNDGPNAVPPS